ncbi:2,3-diaminopropionate biosynthesis protein SbnB [Zhengella mangrovi]|uniref:2,3-diaminopropionate biosynthesis protein SbnB n=1 Tax=Zhengella mangrovi TaxID=1982044 RepID=A0A2G1QGT8_9HYPH|nr:2,3-diaminopropionate biosynthesis protein SbnB [Zhengella mangrovi]PHP64723.1 2,3-diaminopropionate biosynthesis protein SbnB [Zhengella mangrovi]
MRTVPKFHVVGGDVVKEMVESSRAEIFATVEKAYRLHAAGKSVNPDSYFLRYPDNPSARIIALPAHLGGDVQRSGIKWIASFPENIKDNLARASAVQILNDATTGYPLACLDAALTSATRTAASAALAAENLAPAPFEGTLCVVGTGVIARTTIEWLLFREWKFDRIVLFDLSRAEADRFANWLRTEHGQAVEIADSLEGAIRASSLVLFTTTSATPYVEDASWFDHAPTVLHVSLRDISADIILGAQNILDDVEHCMKANTSVHLAEQKTGNRDFVDGTLVDVLEGKVRPDKARPRIFSPFGLGVLDVAVCNMVLEQAVAKGKALEVPNFLAGSTRW